MNVRKIDHDAAREELKDYTWGTKLSLNARAHLIKECEEAGTDVDADISDTQLYHTWLRA